MMTANPLAQYDMRFAVQYETVEGCMFLAHLELRRLQIALLKAVVGRG